MIKKSVSFIAFAFVGICLQVPTLAQVEVTGQVATKLNDSTGVKVVGDSIYLDDGVKLATSKVLLIRVDTEASAVQLTAREITKFPPTSYPPKPITGNVYEISQPGKWWIVAKVHDRSKDLWGESEIFLELVEANPQPPGPGPGPNPPNPDPPSPVPNTYGVGVVAYSQAPRDPNTAAKQAAIYKKAADFLFGVPSLKFVYSSNDAQNKDPNRSVFAWIALEQSKLQCSDRETCEAWKACREKLASAFIESQTKRQ